MIHQTKLNFEAKQINKIHSLNVEKVLINTTLILKHVRFLISNNSLAVKYIISFLIIVSQYWEFIIHYFLDVSYIPSCTSGSRNFKMAKLEEPRHVGKPVAHMDMGKKMNIFMSHFLQVYIQTNQFITLSLMRNELYILVNFHPNCALLKWLDRLKNMINTCNIMVQMITAVLHSRYAVAFYHQLSHLSPWVHDLLLWLRSVFSSPVSMFTLIYLHFNIL